MGLHVAWSLARIPPTCALCVADVGDALRGAGAGSPGGCRPDDASAFLAGGYLRGSAPSMPGAMPMGARDEFDGFYIAGRLEKALSDNAVPGFGLSYSDVDGQPQSDGKAQAAMGATIDAQVGAGVYQARTTRNVTLGTTPFTLRARDNALASSAEVGAGYMFGSDAVEFSVAADTTIERDIRNHSYRGSAKARF